MSSLIDVSRLNDKPLYKLNFNTKPTFTDFKQRINLLFDYINYINTFKTTFLNIDLIVDYVFLIKYGHNYYDITQNYLIKLVNNYSKQFYNIMKDFKKHNRTFLTDNEQNTIINYFILRNILTQTDKETLKDDIIHDLTTLIDDQFITDLNEMDDEEVEEMLEF